MSGIKIQEKRAPKVPPVKDNEPDLLAAFWRFFSATRTAIILLMLLAAASFAGSLIENETGNSVDGSWWYSTLMLVVGLNLAACGVHSLAIAWRTLRPDVATRPGDVARMPRSETLEYAGTPEAVAEKAAHALRSRRYHVFTQSSGQSVSLYAVRGRAGLWGAVLTIIGLFVIFTGVVTGHPISSDNYLTIMEGKRTSEYHREKVHQHVDLPFEIGLKDFSIQVDKDRNLTDHKSDLQVFEGGWEVARKVVDKDHSLTYKGLSFQQSDYGIVGLVLKVTAPDGQSAFLGWDIDSEDTPTGRTYALADQPLHQFPLGKENLTLFIRNLVPDYVGGTKINGSALPLNPAVEVMFSDHFTAGKRLESLTPLGWMTIGKPAMAEGYTITLERVVNFTVLQVTKDRDLSLVYAGLALALLGMVLSFSMKHREIRVCVSSGRRGSNVSGVTAGAASSGIPANFDGDFQSMREALSSTKNLPRG